MLMNLKMLSIERVHPTVVLLAVALNPVQILRPTCERSIGVVTSKKRGDLPIYFRLVSLKASLITQLMTI